MKFKDIHDKKLIMIAIIISSILMITFLGIFLYKGIDPQKEIPITETEQITSIPYIPLEPAITIPKEEPPVPPIIEESPIIPPENNNSDNNEEKALYKKIFQEKNAMVIGDSMAEGLTAYGVLDNQSVIWKRGRRIDIMTKDLPPVIEAQPKYLFLAYGSNDLKMWNGNVDSFISSYQKSIEYIQSVLPNTTIIINSVLPASAKAQQKDPAFQYQELFNTHLKELADSLNIDFLENSSFLLEKENPYSSDGVHPKAFFFQKWGKNMADYLIS